MALWTGIGIASAACRTSDSSPPAAHVGATNQGGSSASAGTGGVPPARADAAGSSGSAGGMAVGCAGAEKTPLLALASAPLNASPPLQLSATSQLLGEGLATTLMPQQLGHAGLRWAGDRMFMLTDKGYWDVPLAGPARWYPTSTVGVLGVRAADLDGDGDQDILLLSMQMNTEIGSDDASVSTSPVVTRLTAWERMDSGLVERSEITSAPGLIFPFPYALGDLNGDAAIDVVGFEQGMPVGYVQVGAFEFSRRALGEASPEYADKLVALVDYADRNQDGSPDLLVLAGESLDVRAFVLLGDGSGRFGAPGSASNLIAALVPHGPSGMGFGIADVTGDGLADVLVQDPQGSETDPILRLYVSTDSTTLAPSIELRALGFEFADVDSDGRTDIVTTLHDRLTALLARGNGTFEPRELGVDMAMPAAVDFVVDPGRDAAPPAVHVLYELTACPMCGTSCGARCVFDACVECISDADCSGAHCTALSCVP